MNIEEEEEEEKRVLVDKYKTIYKRYLLVGASADVQHALSLWQMRVLLEYFTEHGQILGCAVEGWRAIHATE